MLTDSLFKNSELITLLEYFIQGAHKETILTEKKKIQLSTTNPYLKQKQKKKIIKMKYKIIKIKLNHNYNL